MSADLEPRYGCAIEAANEAAQMARRYFARLPELKVSIKGPQDYITEADGAIERLIAGRLKKAFPSDAVLGEEGGGDTGDRMWVIDPIDGTANFSRGFGQYGITIAFVENARTEFGIVAEPEANALYTARRGGGAYRNGRPIRVSATHDPSRATVEVGYSMRRPIDDYLAMVGRLVAGGFAVCQVGSAALGLARVAEGVLDGYAEAHLYAWDVLAGELLVREAGGWSNGFRLPDGLKSGGPALASAPALAATLREMTGISPWGR
ncbi:MAG: inositol monophosphatase [Rhodospirillales bacterium]|nr:inositol monophosphatase [Rhodospirillales bacterium]